MTEAESMTYKIDRTNWPSGPWDHEPDRLDFEHAGFSCLALRSGLGNWCGYVGVERNHPVLSDSDAIDRLEVHGGVTYGPNKCRPPICHIPRPGMTADVLWIGFDCGHCDDFWGMGRQNVIDLNLFSGRKATYRTLKYVKKEIESLAEQLASMR